MDGRRAPLCATRVLHRGFTGGYPYVIQSFFRFYPGSRSNSAQTFLQTSTLWEKGRLYAPHPLLLISKQSSGPLLFSPHALHVPDTSTVMTVGMYGVYPEWYRVVYRERCIPTLVYLGYIEKDTPSIASLVPW